QLGVRGPAVLVRLEQADRPDADLLQHAVPVADDERAKTGPANDDELGHLHQHTDGTAVHRIADVDASEYNEQSHIDQHDLAPSVRACPHQQVPVREYRRTGHES